ncbi:MAG: NDP-sugar synthase [Sedimentisphaerales bacterium]|nr:NDP-sugar synthase [Sedimentisphaerales bacterium]
MSIKKPTKAVILVGSRDFGRSPLASRLPTALWPIADRSVLERLLHHLDTQGLTEAVVCSSGNAALLQKHNTITKSIRLSFLDEQLPSGTAGCIRDAVDGDMSTPLLVLHAAIVLPPAIDSLVQTHQAGNADLTVMLKPGAQESGTNDFASMGIYICEPSILKYIPKKGYCDIKEGLIPAMVQAGQAVNTAVLNGATTGFQHRAGYLTAIGNFLASATSEDIDLPRRRWNDSTDVWLADCANVDSSARIYGPVVIMDGAAVSENVIIFGPVIIGRNVTIERNTFIRNSVFWDGSSLGQGCEIHNSVLDYDAAVPSDRIVDSAAVTSEQNSMLGQMLDKAVLLVSGKSDRMCPAVSKGKTQTIIHKSNN